MFNMKLLQGLALATAAGGFGLSAPDALAGGCSSGYSSGGYYHSGRNVSVGYHGPNFSFHVSAGRQHYRSSRSYCDTPRVYYHNTSYRSTYRSSAPVYHQTRHVDVTYHQPAPQPCGYWRQVWVPPVYATHYDACGYPYRVQVSAGYYDRVWVR